MPSAPVSLPALRIPILTYHQIDAAPARRVPFRCFVTTPASFKRQMRLLKALGYQGLSISALQPYLSGERQGKVFGITFDDGYVNTFRHALPLLHSLGFSSTSYIVSGQLGGSNLWDRIERIPPQPLVDAAQLKEWIAGGQEVGAHTHTHVELLHCDSATARAEILRSKEVLEQVLGREIRHFCYPYGRYGAEHVALVREIGFETGTSTRDAGVTVQDSLHELPRHTMLLNTSCLGLWARIATDRYDQRLPGLAGSSSPPVQAPPSLPSVTFISPE